MDVCPLVNFGKHSWIQIVGFERQALLSTEPFP